MRRWVSILGVLGVLLHILASIHHHVAMLRPALLAPAQASAIAEATPIAQLAGLEADLLVLCDPAGDHGSTAPSDTTNACPLCANASVHISMVPPTANLVRIAFLATYALDVVADTRETRQKRIRPPGRAPPQAA